MRQWFHIYNQKTRLHRLLPSWYYGVVGLTALGRIERERRCRYPHLDRELAKLGQRPLLMIHGGDDAYITPRMAEALYERVAGPKEIWLVEGAKHNGALALAGAAYERRILEFFDRHLGGAQEETGEEPRRQADGLPGPHFHPREESAKPVNAER
jgi:pimeloyl-ACP methyl ester carboxylesterase